MKLYKYQQEYLAKLPRDCIMAADTGTGKTVMALAHSLSNTPVLVLAPASKVRTGDWQEEAKRYGIPEHLLTVQSYEKATRKASATAYYLKGQKAFWWEQYVSDNPEFVLICDEVHKAKNPQSLTGKGVYMLARLSKQFIGLSATPLPNGWVDICNYGKIFGWWKHKTEFWQRYVIEQRIPNQHWSKITGYRDEDTLRKYWESVALPLKKEEALDLPPLVSKTIRFDKPKQYDQIRKTRIYQAEELDNISKLINALRRSLIDLKVSSLIDILEGTEENVVVFYSYIAEREKMIEAIQKHLPNKKIIRQDGERHEVPSKSEWQNIKNSVTLGHYKSASTGIEMQYATIAIFYSPNYSFAEYSQSVGRIYRSGQNKKCTLYYMCTMDTIEQDIYKALKQKKTFDSELWYNSL